MQEQPLDENDFQLTNNDGASEMDVLERYAAWPEKGEVVDGRRITIMAEKNVFQLAEGVVVSHVFEAVESGHELFIMGPKPIFDEYVNGRLRGEPTPAGEIDPFAPQEYDGRVAPSPGIDANFATRQYRFSKPGRYEICWRPGRWQSNTLLIDVR